MSDILLHNAIVENQRLLKTHITKSIDPGTPIDLSYYACNSLYDKYNSYYNSTRTLSQCPTMVTSWKKYLTPLTTPKANGLKICDTSGYYRCGASCTWTVPSGVTKVQFQLWGHGGGNSGQCCCGGSVWGPTGSYATACVTVTPGESFSLCAGCAYCCYANQTTPGYNYRATCVCSSTTGFFITANGAVPDFYNWCYAMPGTSWSTCGPITNDGCNPESCGGGWNFCWDSNYDNICVPHAFSKCETWCVCCNTRSAEVYGLPAIYPAISIGCSLEGNNNTFQISPPVFGFESCTCCLQGNPMCIDWGGCCFGAQNGYQQIPAVGGYGRFSCGGVAAYCGDAGGMGMICVSWN